MKKYNLNLREGEDFRVREDHWLPRMLRAEYFVFGTTLYCQNKKGRLPEHEFLHVAQFAEYGTFAVIMHYLYHGIRNLIKYKNAATAFQEIPFEVEARTFALRTMH